MLSEGHAAAEQGSTSKGNPTLRSRLMRSVLVPLLVILLVDIAGSYFIVRHVANSVYDVELDEIAREMLLNVTHDKTNGFGFNLSAEAERTLFLDEEDEVYYVIRSMDGDIIAGDPSLPVARELKEGRETIFYDDVFQGQPVRMVVMRGQPLVRPFSGPVWIQVAETLDKRTRYIKALLWQVILPQVLLILIAGTMIWRGVAHGLAPLRKLQHEVGMRSHLDLSPIRADKVPGEVEPLVGAVNDLMTRVDAVLGFQERFIADTAHQLRTPVAGLKAHIELALRETELPQIQRALGHLYTSAERLSRLVSQLLSLARNEPHNVAANFALFDLNQLALRTTQDWVPHAYKKQIDLGFEAAEQQVFLNGEAARVTEMINNLVDNAIRYTPAGGRVTVRITQDEAVHLIVSDDGPRIPIEERKRIFERFHRLLGSHEEGSGLGLAIVHEIATLHNAQIDLNDDVDGVGNTFTVSFPVSHIEL
jgi:two-component system sensor histidine kinase TctE